MQMQKPLRASLFALFLGMLVFGQFVTAIPPGEPPAEPVPPPPPPRPPDAQGWLCLNGEEVRWSSTDSFSFAATYRSWVVAAIEGCDQASFSLKRKGIILQEFIVRPGYVLCQPYEFDNKSWPENVPPADTLDEYCIQIDPAQAQYFTMLAVLPQVLAEGNGTLNLTDWLQVPFRGAGRVHCLFAGNFSITELAACLELDGDDPIVWKQNNYTGSDRYPVQIGEFVAYVQGGQYLQFDADLPAGDHALLLKGNGSAQWAILADGDGDLDGLADVYEVQLGMDMYEPDVWGTRTMMPAAQSLQGVMDAQAVGAFWQRVECQVYISPVFQDATHFLYAEAVHGQFENFSIDGDPFSLVNLTLVGFRGTSDELVWLRDNDGAMQQVPENCLHYTDPGFLGQVGPGSHTIAYYQKSDPFQEPEIAFRDNFCPITILTDDTAANPAIDSDNDGLSDGMDREPFNALQWHPETALRLAIPYTFEDRQDQADLQVTLSVAPPEHDYTTRAAPVAWHVGEGEDGTGVRCHVVPVVRCYGLGPAGRDDYWYKSTTWEQFWGKTVVTKSIVGVDAIGNAYSAATTGLGFLPNPTNETKDPGLGDPATGYTYFLYPEQANKSWAYTLRIPRDHPLLQNNSQIPTITFDFAWQVLEENPNNGTLSLAHIYNCLDNVTIQSAVATYVATAGSGALRYILGKPQSHAEYVALQSLAANPACEVTQPPGARPLNASIVKAEQGVGLLPMYHFNKNNLTTLSVADRIAHWREIYPRNPSDSEVIFYCGKEKTVNILQELAAGVQYDCHADPTTIPGGEIQYADVPATWSFGGLADTTRAYNIDNDWAGGPWDGSENAQVITRARHFRKVLQLQPFKDAYNAWIPAWASVDAGAPADNASVEFWLVLGHKVSETAPDGILDIKISDASGTIGPWLRFHGERMEYGSRNPETGEITFKVLDDVAAWPDEPIRVSIWYNCTNGTFFVDLGGVAFNWSNYVPFHDPANKPAALQVVNFTARYVPACIDAIGLTQAPQGSGDCGGATYNRSNNAVDYAAWHAGDEERLVAWTQISNVSQGEIPPEQLQGDYNVLWGVTYNEQIHARREITFVSFPLRVQLTRASDSNTDGFETSDHVVVLAAKGTTPLNSIPSKLSDIIASDINDEGITFTRETTLAHASRVPSAEPPQVQFNDAFDAYFERDDLRERERDWWAAYYRSGTEKPAGIDFTIIHTEEWYWDKTQLARNLIELLVNDKLEVLQALQQSFGDPGTIWVERLLLKRNELQMIHVLEGQSFDPQTGLFSFGEPDAFGNHYFTWDVQPEVIPANQFLTTGPNAVVEFTEKGYAYFIRRFTAKSCEAWAKQVVDAFQTHAEYRAAFGSGGSMEMLWPVDFKSTYSRFKTEIIADFHSMSLTGLEDAITIQNFISKWNARFGNPIVNLPTISSIDDLFVDVDIKQDVLKKIKAGEPVNKPPILRPRQITVDNKRFALENKHIITGKEGDSPVTRRVGTWKYRGEAFIYPLPKGKFLIMPRATYEAIQPVYRAAFTINKVLPGDKLRVNVLGYITHAPDVTLEMHRILGNHPALLQRPLAYFILTMEQVELMHLPNGMTGKAAIQQLGLWTKWKRVEGLLSGPKGAEALADRVLGAYDPKGNPSWQFASNLFLQYAKILDEESVSEVKSQNAKPFDRAQYNRDYYGSVEGQVSHHKLALLNLQTFSRPREEYVLTRLRERLDHWATIYATDHRAFGVSEFKACVLDLARSVVEDACLKYGKKTATPVLSILKNGYNNFPRNKDSIGSLVQLFGEDMGQQLLKAIERAVPEITPQYSLEAKQKIEALYPTLDTQLPTREFIGVLLGDPVKLQAFWDRYGLSMMTQAGFPQTAEDFREALEAYYLNYEFQKQPVMGGGLPMYQVMEFPSETGIYPYALSMGWDFDMTYSVVTQWRMAQMKAFIDIPALPSAGFSSKLALLDSSVEAIQLDTFAIETSKVLQEYRLVIDDEVYFKYLEALLRSDETGGMGVVMTENWYEPLYAPATTGWKSELGIKVWDGWRVTDAAFEVIGSSPNAASTWSSRGTDALVRFLPMVFLDLIQRIPAWFKEVDERTTKGQPATNAWTDVLVRDIVPILINALVDVYVVDAILVSADLVVTAACTFWEGIALNALAWVAAIVVKYVIDTLWYNAWAQQEQFSADVLTELNLAGTQEWVFPAETNASIVRHGGLEVGDVVIMKTTVENRGFRKYQDQGFFNYQPLNDDDAGEGSAFWYQARYCIQGSSGWSNWNGSWDTTQLLYPYREYYSWLIGLFERSAPRSLPDVKTYLFTLTQACASPSLICEFQVASEFHTRTNHDVQTSTQLMPDFHVMERSISEFMARATPLQSSKSPAELQVECTRAQREFRWKDAAQAAQQASVTASAQPLVSEAEFNDLLARRVELGVPGAPQGYDPFWGYWQDFTQEEQQAYALLTCTGLAEFAKFFPAPGTANAMRFAQQGFRAVAPAWSMLAVTTILEETFASTSWSLLQQRGWTVSSREPYGLQGTEIRPQYEGRNGTLYIEDRDSGRGFNLIHSLQAMACGEAAWEVYHLYTKPWGTLAGYDPLYTELNTDSGTTITVYIDNDVIYCNGLALSAAAEYTWYSFRVTWDCFAGTCAVWANGQLLRTGIPLLVTNPTTRPVIEFKFRTGVSDVMGTAALNFTKVTGEEGYLGSQRLGYWNTETPGRILIPKSWFNLTQQAFEAKNQSQALLASIPLQTNIASHPSWGDPFIMLTSGTSTTGAIAFTIDGPDNPLVKVDLIAPPGITATFTPWVGFLHDLRTVNFTLHAEPGVYAGATYLLLNVSCNGNVTAYQRVIPVRVAYEESSSIAIEKGPALVEPGCGFRWATLYNNGTVPQGYLATFADLPEGWLYSDAYVPIMASTFDTGLGGWAGACTSGMDLGTKVQAYAGNLVMETPQQAEQLSATLAFPAPIEVRPGDVIRVSLRGACAGGLSLVAGESFSILTPGAILTGYKDVELAFTEFHTISNLTLIGTFKPGDNVWVDAVVLEACTTRHAHEVWQQFSDSTASLNDYGWNITFASGTPDISAWGSIIKMAYTSAADLTTNYGAGTTVLAGPGYNTFIQIPEYPSALLPYANLSSVGQYLYILHDPAYNNEVANLLTWATGPFNETTSGSFPGVTWATQPGFTHLQGNYSLGAGTEPAWIRIDATGWAWIGLNATAPHQFWSDDAGVENSRPAVRFTIPKAGLAGGYLVVQSDVADAFNLTLDLRKNLSMNAGDSIRLGFNVTGAISLNVTAGEFFAINPSAAGHYEMVLPFTTTIANLANLTIKGTLPAGGSFNLDFLEVYHVQPFGDVLGNTTLGGIYNDTSPLNTIQGYSPLIACTFSGTLDGFESITAPDLPACIVVNGSLYINGSSPAPEDIPIRGAVNAQLPAGARVRVRACLNATEVGALIIEGPGLYYKQMIPVTGQGNWSEVTWTCTEASIITWITLDACLSAGEYLAVDYVLVEQPANAQPVAYAVGRRDVLPLKMVEGYLSAAEISFSGMQADGIWEGWVYLPFLGAALGLAFLDLQRRLACQLTFNNTHLVVTNGTGIAVTTGDFSFFQHVQVAWDCVLGNWSVKVNNITAFPVNYTDGMGILSLAPAITSLASLRLDIGDAGTYYLDGIQCGWCANYTGSFIQSPTNASATAFWLVPGERRVFYVTPTYQLPDQSFLALFADAYTGQIRGVFDGTVISQPTYNIGLSSLSPITQYCVAGEQLTYTMKVTNEGTLSDTFWVSCDNYGSAIYSLTPTSINLRPGESVCAKLVVSPTSLDVNYLTVRVASTHNETVLHLWVVANEVSFVQIPDEISYVVGTTGNSFSWSASACWTGDPSYSLAVDGITIASNLDWAPGETEYVSVDDLEEGSHLVEVRISAGVYGIDASHTVAIYVLPSVPLPPDTTAPLIQVTGEMEPTCPVGDIVLTAAISDGGGSGLAQTLLYYTTGDWSAAKCVSFDGDVATIPMAETAVLLGSYHTVGAHACTVSYFLYARDAAGNGAILDQDGWRVASVSDVSSYTGVPYSVQVVNTPVVGSLRLACDHVLGAGSGMELPALFTLYYPGNDYAWRRPFYARAFINIGSDVRFIDATCVRDLGPFSSLWYVDLNELNAFAVEEFYITVKDSDFGFISLGGSGYSTLHNPDFIQLNPASVMPASPSVSNIHVDRDPNGVGWSQGVIFDLTYSDLVDMSVLGDIMGYFNPSSVVVWYNYWGGDDGNWNSIAATPVAFTSDYAVRYRAEFYDESYAPYSNMVQYYIQVCEIGISGPFYQSNVTYLTPAAVQANPLTFNQTYYMNPDITDYLPPEIGIPTIPASCVDPALELDQKITCPVADLGGSRLAWARVYYRAGTQAWDIARYIPLVGGVAILPHDAWADFDVVEYYIGAGDNTGNIAFRGVAGLGPSDAVAQANPFLFTVGSNTVIFYKTQFLPTSTMHLFPRELGDDFSYSFTLQNVGNAPQEYEITTTGLVPHAIPAFIVPDIVQGVPSFQVSLAPSQILTFSLALSTIEPRKCNFTVIATSLTSGEVREIPASYFINRPPVVTPAGDVTYEQGTTGHALEWAITDTSPVPDKQNWFGIYTNATPTGPWQHWATFTFDGMDSNDLPEGWFTDEPGHAGTISGQLRVNGWFTFEEYGNAWASFGDRESGTVEWYNYPEYGIMEAGLFRDGIPIATVTGGKTTGSQVPTSINGISMGHYYNYISLTFDAISGTCRALAGYDGEISWDSGEIPLLASLVPNEFRVRILGYWVSPLGGEYAGLGGIDSVGFSWDPKYNVGDNAHVSLVQSGQFDPAGEIIVLDVSGLLPDPVVGFADYKFIFLASDKWVNSLTGRPNDLVSDFSVVRVLTPDPAVVPISGDITYEYGTSGNSLAWRVVDAYAPNPTYEVWGMGSELPGHYRGTESFTSVSDGVLPPSWYCSDAASVGVVGEFAGHSKVLNLNGENFAGTSFQSQITGTIEWYQYAEADGQFYVQFGDAEGSLLGITAKTRSGPVYSTTPSSGTVPWHSMQNWHRFRLEFNIYARTFSLMVFIPGEDAYTMSGNFIRDSAGISTIRFSSLLGIYGQPAIWYVDALGLDWDPFYEVGDLLLLEQGRECEETGTWSSGSLIEFGVDGLEVGTHAYTFVAYDGNGVSASWESLVTVYNAPPVFASEPAPLTFLAGTLAPSLEWVLADISTQAPSYHILVDGTIEAASGPWVSGEAIAWNPSALLLGEHVILLELDDGLGGTLQDKVIVRSNDQVSFVNVPIDFSYHVGESSFNIGWTVSDLLGLNPTYDVFIRGFEGEEGFGTLFTSGTWASGPATSIIMNLGGMPAGLYLSSIFVADGLGTQAMDQVVFCVTPDGMNPLDWLESQVVEAGSGMTCGTSSGDVTVDVTFDTAEDTQVAIGIWDAPPQPLGPDFATEGTYFTVDAEREAAVTFPIYVTVTLPGGFPVGMTESDVAAWLRMLTFDELSGEWIDPHFLVVDIDMVAGTATFEVTHLSTFALGFANGLPPKIDGPGSLTYELNAPAPQLVTWRLADLTVGSNPTYAVFLDGAIIAQGMWAFGTEVTVDTSGLLLGIHNLEMIAFDDLGGSTSHHVPVEVCNMPPVVDQPADVIYEVGSLGHSITWVPLDISVGVPNYIATIDGIQIASGTWASGAGIPISVDGLMPGTHVVEITIGDGLGGSASDQAAVFVTNMAPVVATQGTITYEAGDPRPVVEWVVTDPSVFAGDYVVYCDGNPVASGQWVPGMPFSVSVSGLTEGTHSYTCVVEDGYGESGAGNVDVIVIPDDDVSPPIIVNVECTPVLDTTQWIPMKVFAFDSGSGIGQVVIEYNGQLCYAELAGDYYAVNLPNPGVAGTLTAMVTAWDNDRDYPGDALSASQAVPVTIINTAPQVTVYFTNATLAGEYPATYTFSDHDLVPFSTGWVSGVQSIPGQPTPGVLGDYCRILPEYIGHKDVLQLFKNASVAQVITACFVGQEIPSGSVELWVAVEGDASFMAALSSFTAGISVWIVVVQGQLAFVSADGSVTWLGAFSPGWHRLQIDFAGAGTSIAGLPENHIALTLDGTSLGALDAGAPLHVTGFADAASQVGNASSPAEGSLYLDAVDFSWDSNYVSGRNRAPGIYLPQEPSPEVTILAGEDGAALQWLPSDVASVNPQYEIFLDGAPVVSDPWASGTLIAWDISGLEPGDYNVEMVLDDGMGGVATSQVILHVQSSSHVILDEIDELIRLIEESADSDWRKPACQRKQVMIDKLYEVRALVLAGDIDEAYEKLLHDIKPKLTGLKTDENETAWGNGIYPCPWMTSPELRQECKDLINSILRGLSPESGGTPPPCHHGWHSHPHHPAHGHHASPHGGCHHSAHHECNAASKKWCKN